jgi:hypothetical protein
MSKVSPLPMMTGSEQQTLLMQAELLRQYIIDGHIKAFIAVGGIGQEGEHVLVMGMCPPVWGREALSVAMKDYIIPTH